MPLATSGSSADGHLVADDQLRLGGERAGDADALLLAAGKLGRIAVDETLAHLDLVEQFGDARVALAAAHAEIEFERPADDGADGLARVHRHVGHLVDHLQLAQILLGPVGEPAGSGRAVEGDRALLRAAAGR